MQEKASAGRSTDLAVPAPQASESVGAAPRRRLWLTLAPVMIFAAVVGLFGAALRKGDPSRIPSALIGRPAPVVALTPIEGLDVPLPALGTGARQGQPYVLNFWASWCVPCVEEHPQLIALVQRTGVALYGINHKDQAANARRFLERYGNPFSAIGADTNGRAAIEWGVYGMPETFIVDGAGRVAHKHVGPISPEALEKRILPALEKAKGRP